MKLRFDGVSKELFLLGIGLFAWPMPGRAQSNTGEATVEFSRSSFIVRENLRSANILIRRTGNTNIAVTVDFTTTDGSARAGVNYQTRTGPVTLAPGKMEETVAVPLIDNLEPDGNKTIRLALSNPSDGAGLGAQSQAELVMDDNDNRASAWLTFGLDRIEALNREIWGIPVWQYLASFLYIFLAFYVSKGLDHLIRGRLKKWAEKSTTRLDELLLALLRGPIKIIAFVIFLRLGLRIFSWPEWMEKLLSAVLYIIVALAITYLILKVIDLVLGVWGQKAAPPEDTQFHQQLVPMVRNSLKVFAVVVAVLVTLQNLGLNITGLVASLGIGGLALALAAQDTLANLFGAIAVLVDKPFRVGDQIKLDNVEGTVETIGFRCTRVRNVEGHLVSIPNKTVGNATITNITQRPNIRTLVNIGLTYDTPADKVQRALVILNEIYRGHPMTQDVWISFNKFADFSLNIFVVHWWKATVFKDYLDGMQELNLTIKRRFDEESIGFAFPTQTVHLKQDSVWRLSGDGPSARAT